MDYVNLGSSLSIRRFSRLGGDSTSVFDMMNLGSSLSIRSFARLGSSLSVAGDQRIAGDLKLEQTKKLMFNGVTNDDYVKGKAGGGLEFYAGSNALRLALGTTSYLHGSWVAANAQFTASDAGLKKNIVPLYKSLSKLQQARRIAASSDSSSGDVLAHMDKAIRSNDHLLSEDKSFNKQYNTTMMSEDAIRASQMGDQASKYATDLQDATALFKELRPVSYVMKEKGQVEAKNLRFGFIAQEVEALLPSLVHTDENDGKKALMYNDLIAVVIMTLQQELSVVEGLKLKVEEHDSKLTTVDERIAMLETEIMALREALLQKKLIDAQPEGQSLLSKATASSDIEITQAAVTANQGSQQRRSKEPQLPVGRKQEQEIAAADIPTIMA
jgi:hypothetical protein